jgi:hypothetical protein
MTSSVVDNIIKIREGKIYPFSIIGISELPDGTEYFILSDPNQVKHLLEKKHFIHYNFEVGQLITCRIDKINCNGKIYIEPLHPYYRLGKSYDFPLINIVHDGNNNNMAVFEDVFGNEIMLPLDSFAEPPRIGLKVRLNVTRIKKGLIYLSEPGYDIKNSGLKTGLEYAFTIKGFINNPGNRSYFIIATEEGAKFKLRFKFYENYGLKVGQTINCRLIKNGRDLFFEPSHPSYKINHWYDFEVIGEKGVHYYPTGEKKVYILRNNFGKNILLPAEKVNPGQIKNNKINCRVKDIRKARIFLTCRKQKKLPQTGEA